MSELVSLSKFISLILRHKPETVGLTLDSQGYADVKELIEGIKKHSDFYIDEYILKFIVSTDDKKRYSYSEDGTKIRANQGHSFKVDLGLKKQEPPKVLYHGTGEKYLESILRQGLKSKSRNHVHLSKDIETAVKVGKRHGKPVVLKVDAGRMYAEGYEFYLSENGVWLTEAVPVEYIGIESKM